MTHDTTYQIKWGLGTIVFNHADRPNQPTMLYHVVVNGLTVATLPFEKAARDYIRNRYGSVPIGKVKE